MQTCFNSSVLSPVVGSAVAKSVWIVFRSWVQIPFFLSPKLASIFSIYCHTADELCGSDPWQALIWFWESTGTVLSYCLNENDYLFYNSAAYWWWVLQVYSIKNIITVLLSNLWPLTIAIFEFGRTFYGHGRKSVIFRITNAHFNPFCARKDDKSILYWLIVTHCKAWRKWIKHTV